MEIYNGFKWWPHYQNGVPGWRDQSAWPWKLSLCSRIVRVCESIVSSRLDISRAGVRLQLKTGQLKVCLGNSQRVLPHEMVVGDEIVFEAHPKNHGEGESLAPGAICLVLALGVLPGSWPLELEGINAQALLPESLGIRFSLRCSMLYRGRATPKAEQKHLEDLKFSAHWLTLFLRAAYASARLCRILICGSREQIEMLRHCPTSVSWRVPQWQLLPHLQLLPAPTPPRTETTSPPIFYKSRHPISFISCHCSTRNSKEISQANSTRLHYTSSPVKTPSKPDNGQPPTRRPGFSPGSTGRQQPRQWKWPRQRQ